VLNVYDNYHRHIEYQSYLLDHLLNVTLRHWDSLMRQLGAQSLRLICQSDLPVLAPKAAKQAVLGTINFHVECLVISTIGATS
jgi:hypothetical protein